MNQASYMKEWDDKFCKLCYEVFVSSPKGAELLKLMEDRFFRAPVAFPNQEPSWAFFNEGRNEMIRSFSAAINKYMNGQRESAKTKIVKRGVK